MLKEIFIDKSGKLSSKRMMGIPGALLFFALAAYLVFSGQADKIPHLWPVASLIGALLGLSIGEKK